MKRFSSAKDALFYGILMPTFVCFIVLTVVFAWQRLYIPLIGLLIIDLLFLSISLFTYYEFDAEALVIVSGPFRWRVKYQDIHAVFRTRDVTSAPALARNRLAIILKSGGRVLISPSNESLFFAELQKRNHAIDLRQAL
jgi:hypothetical protein